MHSESSSKFKIYVIQLYLKLSQALQVKQLNAWWWFCLLSPQYKLFVGVGQVQNQLGIRHEPLSVSVFKAATDIYLDFSKAFHIFSLSA